MEETGNPAAAPRGFQDQGGGAAQAITRRGALRLEVAGLRRSRGQSMLTVVNQVMGTSFRTAKDAYPAYDAWVSEHFGAEPYPLSEREQEA
jgi:hypothetical protein